ncbi:MAG: DUF4906 domain-containing protein [Bacteroides sp.]|nr:DUF4906 domain-containing protein [Bacteroides sp.]
MAAKMKYISGMLLAGCIITSCTDDEVNASITPLPDNTVNVELSIDLEDNADAASLYPQAPETRSDGKEEAVDVRLTSVGQTRMVEDALGTAKADNLYELHIFQFTSNGVYSYGQYFKDTTALGKKVKVALKESDDCQLVIYVRGGTSNDQNAAGGGFTQTTWQTFKAPYAWINSIATVGDMSKMPYYLHLKSVKVKAVDTTSGIIQSLTGEDVRLRIRRLAARLNVSWTYAVEGYTLQEVTLQDIPLDYIAFPSTTKDSYPELVDQCTIRKAEGILTDKNGKGSFSCWMPRSIRGTNSITSPTRRGKQNVPQGSPYLRFVAVNNNKPEKELIYRVYLGGNTTNDFNILDNTNYNYTLTFNHTDELIWQKDDRVEYQGGLSADANNNTPVPTANCIMVEPGGSFYFDPFRYRQAGKDIENTVLSDWAKKSSRGGMKSVKLLWQMRENRDVGDPVMGIVNSANDHSNVVTIKRTDGGGDITTNPADGPDQCRIYCRVAANTTGGNGLIAACDANGDILWSWHIWVTKYNPDPHGDETVLTPNKQKHKYTFRSDIDQYPMMDRYLGALEDYTDAPTEEIDKSRANGLHYEWGRKDPFPGSFTTEVLSTITISTSITTPIKGLYDLYGPDGYTFSRGQQKAL